MASGLENIETVESPFRRFVTTIGVFPTAFTDAMTYYECLAYLVKYMEETLIPAINENAEAVEELQGLYIQLKAYVDNYFDNLDVQEEINNKLDQMAEAGTLQEIITTYIQANTAWCFNTVADMKSATNLIDGSFAQTLGYHAINDGGKALYKIRQVTNNDTEDDAFIIALADEDLVAELIIPENLRVEVMGAYGDNTHDDIIAIQKAMNSSVKHIVLSKVYKVSTPITVPSQKIVDGGGEIHSDTVGIKMDGVRYTKIKDLRIFAGITGVLIVSDSSYCSYITLEDLYLNGYISEQSQTGEKGIYIHTTSNYINECYYVRCVAYNYQYGIYASAEGSDPQMQRHIFTECSPEGSTVAGVYVKNGERFTFENCRCLEGNSSKWITEGTCSAFNIISGEAWFSPSTNAQFSTGTNGTIIGALRNANVGLSSPGRNGFIVSGKVIASLENINPYFKNITSAGLTIAYGDELVTQFRMITGSDTTLSLTSDCYGGAYKVNEFYIRTNAGVGNLTVQVGNYFTKVITGPATSGYKYYRFTYNTLEADKSWFVEELNLI